MVILLELAAEAEVPPTFNIFVPVPVPALKLALAAMVISPVTVNVAAVAPPIYVRTPLAPCPTVKL